MKTKRVTFLTGALVAWAALVAFQAGASFGFGTAGLIGLLFVGALVGLVVGGVIGLVFRRWSLALYSLALLVPIVASVPAARNISARERHASITAAQPIIVAAERFRFERGSYPETLDQLVPAYLPTEPLTRMGFRGTRYRLSSTPSGFRVTFALPAWMLCSYDSESKQWDIHD